MPFHVAAIYGKRSNNGQAYAEVRPDGRVALSGSGRPVLVDLARREVLEPTRMALALGPEGRAADWQPGGALALTRPDGSTVLVDRKPTALSGGLFVGASLVLEDGNQPEVYDADTGRRRGTLAGHRPSEGLLSIRFGVSPDGRTLVTTDEHALRFWDLATLKPTRTVRLAEPGDPAEVLVLGPDRLALAVRLPGPKFDWPWELRIVDAKGATVARPGVTSKGAALLGPVMAGGKLLCVGFQGKKASLAELEPPFAEARVEPLPFKADVPDLVPLPDGGLLVCQWNGQIFHLAPGEGSGKPPVEVSLKPPAKPKPARAKKRP